MRLFARILNLLMISFAAFSVTLTAQPASLVLTGGDGLNAGISIDDDFSVFLNGSPIFADNDRRDESRYGYGAWPPIIFAAKNGDILRVIASDTPGGGCRDLSPLYLHRVSDGVTQILDSNGFTRTCNPGSANVFYDKSFTIALPDATGSARFTDNLDGTISDNVTGLMWEKKTACATPNFTDIHCVENRYAWSTNVKDPNGPVFTDFLARLNLTTSMDGTSVTNQCLASHCDWRIPSIAELKSILLNPFPCDVTPCVDPVFTPTAATEYYVSNTRGDSGLAFPWAVIFRSGRSTLADIAVGLFARAVRGGR